MDVKHTLGPWFLEGNWDAESAKPLGGWVSSFPPSGVPVFAIEPLVGSRENICANARMIAAAPELLAALEAFDDDSDCHNEAEWFASRITAARAAIAKALGK